MATKSESKKAKSAKSRDRLIGALSKKERELKGKPKEKKDGGAEAGALSSKTNKKEDSSPKFEKKAAGKMPTARVGSSSAKVRARSPKKDLK